MVIVACFKLPVFVVEILADLSVFYTNSFKRLRSGYRKFPYNA